MPWLTKDTDGNFQSLTFWVMIWVSLSNIEYILNTVLTVILTVIYMTQSFVPLMYYNSMHDTEVRTLRKKSLKKHNWGISRILIDHLDEKISCPPLWLFLSLLRSECQGLRPPGFWNVSAEILCWLQALWGREDLHQVWKERRVWLGLSYQYTQLQ